MNTNEQSSIHKYALIGHPVAHSMSPTIHNSSFKALGLPCEYGLVDSAERGLVETVRFLKENDYYGWNVTMPDKTAMCDLCDEISLPSRITHAVNTIVNKDGKLYGTTTDGEGFVFAAKRMNIDLKGNVLTLLGGGGAAGSMMIAAALEDAHTIHVFCRSEKSRERMDLLRQKLDGESACRILIHEYKTDDFMQQCLNESIMLANATSVGMGETSEASPIDQLTLNKETAVFDAIYHPSVTKLMETAMECGCQTANGLPMLVGQAAASFKLWTGEDMPLTALPFSF
ncbi:MAG: shikimate dehydrogenase [Lachnospiraceae bacterium]|nr:shikimate dehydrogenase [Candidatus Equihabitans merdae]